MQTKIENRPKVVWAEVYIWFSYACALLLLIDQFAPLRSLIRSASLGASLIFLVAVPLRNRQTHPAAVPMLAVVAILALELFHPNTQITSGFASVLLYVAIFGPVFWVTRQQITQANLKRILLFLWLFHSISSVFGILQVAFPGKFQPAASSVFSEDMLNDLSILTATGERVLRPMGLTDTPGGAAVAGFYALLFGLAFFVSAKGIWQKIAFAASSCIGVACIYLSQVRSVLISALVAVIVLALMLLFRRDFVKSAFIAALATIVLFAGFSIAVFFGSESVTNRINTLFADSPQEVYGANRGHFLTETIDLLPRMPLGAGLGRYGMMNSYFGNNQDPDKQPIWAEIMWTAWLYDGGILLILLYVSGFASALLFAYRASGLQVTDDLRLGAIVVFAYDLSALALCFDYVPFLSQGGIEFWILNATLFGAVFHQTRKASDDVSPQTSLNMAMQTDSDTISAR